jgi:phosphoglycolate phosphatase
MNLLLFDIDGILVEAHSIKFDYWKATAKKHFGIDVSRSDVYSEGKTDREVIFELVRLGGIRNPEKDKRFNDAVNDIGNIVAKAIKDEKMEKVPDVERFIKILLAKNVVIGLLTGNTSEKARVKLLNCGLWDYFRIGAFGDKTRIRSELVGIALKEARDKLGMRFGKDDVYIVGDTIRDIKCAREAGVKVIAIATGKESMEMLRKEKPDYLFRDFSRPEKMVSEILGR